MNEKSKGQKTDVEQLKGVLEQFDRGVWAAALSELNYAFGIDVGSQVKSFKKIQFEKGHWDQSAPENGCITYTATWSFSKVDIIFADGTTQSHTYATGTKVYVCGNAAHLPEED